MHRWSRRRCRSSRGRPGCSRISPRSRSGRSASCSRRAPPMSDDDGRFREQLAYLLERSPFYREKLADRDTGGGLESIAQLPLTDKRELKATCTPDNPFGAHPCVVPDEIARIYSPSAPTRAPPTT